MLQNAVKRIIDGGNDDRPVYLRNLIKEEVQDYILNFVYSESGYNNLIFTGGTCLRKVYGLDRLSEDLDFDYVENGFVIEDFAKEVLDYFKSVVGYNNIVYSVASNRKMVFFKLPILKDLGMYQGGTPEDVFVRCDFSKEDNGGYVLEKSMIKAGKFQFFVSNYDFETLFANKLVAFLERSFYKGKFQKIPFKGRDVYDLFWMMQMAARSSFELRVNKKRLRKILKGKSMKQIKKEFREKVKKIDNKFLYDDLITLVESSKSLEGFIDSYQGYLLKNVDFVL